MFPPPLRFTPGMVTSRLIVPAWLGLAFALLVSGGRAGADLRVTDIRRDAAGTVTLRFSAQAENYYVLRRGTEIGRASCRERVCLAV